MTDKTRLRIMWGTLIANAILLGVVVGLVAVSVLALCSVLDQDFRDGRRLPNITEWVIAGQPRELEAIYWLASAVTVTGLFLTYCFCPRSEHPSGLALCLSSLLVVNLVAAAYFLFCVVALAIPKIEIYKDMGAGMEKRLRLSPMHHRPSWVPVEVMGTAAAGYTIGLLVVGLSIRRKRAKDSGLF